MIPKIIALYLPQFHVIKENSEWYGEGFTDWVTVRKAVPLFDGHMQPRKPLNENYYDLGNIETIKWQAALAKQYGVDGFCFYHYWFDSRTRLLEKPAELLLQHKETDISYCFSWANESWKRTWSNVEKGNVWCNTEDNRYASEQEIKNRGILARQRYGREQEWEVHIKYLIPFFKDKRYLKIGGRPVLFIYQPCDIICMKAMLEVWKECLAEEKIDGIYLVGGSYGNKYSQETDMNYNHEPGTAFARCRQMNKRENGPGGMEFFSYDALWNSVLDDVEGGKISCAFTDFDASPRKGCKSTVVKGASPQKFELHFREFMKKNIQAGNELVLINAWNEWGEGMYLEPCEKNGYGYLEAIRSVVQDVKNDAEIKTDIISNDIHGMAGPKAAKSVLQAALLNQWLLAYRAGIRVKDFFYKYGYKSVAVYGMGMLGRQLVDELKGVVPIAYYIDRVEIPGMDSLKRVSMKEELPEADCIVVTVLSESDSIYEQLKTKTNAAIVDIREIIEDLF